EDVVDAFQRAADSRGSLLLNIGSGRETTVLGLYETLARLTGFALPPEFAAAKAGDILRSVLDPSRAKSALGWEPWTPLEEGLRRTVEWYRSRPAG
ncbi:MAG TPA: UDP-glucose 4-epimerase, partial [Acidimicrobiia bacterium]|nr:UDP-glucose 4-epimerase [Acidimicrobiia bacterium]